MDDLFTYLKWRGDIPFSQVPPTPVDALIFSELSYLGFGGIVPDRPGQTISLREATERYFALPKKAQIHRVKPDLRLLKACAETLRFGNAEMTFFRELYLPHADTQFAAVSFLLDDGTAFLAFRGTDYSLTGWKEDFNMSFADSVPAQREALRYTREFAESCPLLLRLGGHSKGGNVAVYAAAKAAPAIQQRILGIYNNDGPGFTDALMGDAGYLAMVPKIHTFIPQSSIIGMLLEHEEPYTVVKSNLFSILQHECFSWEINGGNFVRMDQIDDHSRFIDRTLKTYLAEMDKADRVEFVDAFFSLLTSGGADQVFDLLHPKQIAAVIKSLGSDEKRRNFLFDKTRELLRAAHTAKQKTSED